MFHQAIVWDFFMRKQTVDFVKSVRCVPGLAKES